MSKDSVALSQHAESWQAVSDAFKILQGDSKMSDVQRRETLIVFGDSQKVAGSKWRPRTRFWSWEKGQRGSRDEGDTTEDARDVRDVSKAVFERKVPNHQGERR